jgi:hypothetical protein
MNRACYAGIVADLDREVLARQMESLFSQVRPGMVRERRGDLRVAIPMLFRLTPLDASGEPIEGQASTVVGKNISRRGISFYHQAPIAHRRAILELEHPGDGHFAVEIDVRWCRFRRQGWYESGGQLIGSALKQTAQPVARPPAECNGWIEKSARFSERPSSICR